MKMKLLIAGAIAVLCTLQSIAKGGNPAYDAAARGDVARLKELLATDPSLMDTHNAPNRGLLCVAAMAGQKDTVEFLISKGANVNEKGFEDLTPLGDMAMYGTRDDQNCAEVATVLLAHGAEVDPIDNYQATPLMHAVEAGKSQLAAVLLEHGATLNHRYHGAMGDATLLHMAVYDKDKNMVALLLKYKAPVDAVNRDGATALDLAERRDETEIAAMLRESDPGAAKYTVPPTRDEMRALGKRIADGDESALTELDNTRKKLYSEIKDYQREQPRVIVLLGRMHAAFEVLGEEAAKGNKTAFAALKKCLATPQLAGFTTDALEIAAAGGNKEAFDILSHYQDWNIDEFSARFAICEAAKAGFEPAIDYVASLVSVQNPREFSGGIALEATNALASAVEKGNQKAKDALQKFFASAPNPVPAANAPSTRPPRDPNVPAHWGYLIGDKEALDRVLASTNLMMSRDENGETALEWAVKSHNTEYARKLLEHGAPIPPPVLTLDSADPRMPQQMKNQYLKYFNEQHPALLPWTVTHNDKDMAALLLEFRAPLNAVDPDGNTPLHAAVTARNKEMVKLLLDAKAGLNPTNRQGATPLFIAEAAENTEIADLIKEAATARGDSVTGANVPSGDEMKRLAQRICDGNAAAIGDLKDTAELMYRGVDFRKPGARQRLLRDRVYLAIHLLGEQAGNGNDYAFQALKGFLNKKDVLSSFAPFGLGIAAAGGNEESLKILLNYRQWGIPDSPAYLSLQAPAEAGRQPAVDAFIALLQDPDAARKQFYGVAWLAKQIATSAAAGGNERAKAALQEFAANQPELNSQ